MPLSKNARGFTLVELLVAVAATLVVTALILQVMVELNREQTVRKKVAELQSNARQGLELVEADLRHASLGTSTGVIWQSVSGNRVALPAIQLFTGLPGGTGGAIRDAKPGTDAVLVVEAVPGPSAPRTVTTRALSTSVGAFDVASADGFQPGNAVLLGDYGDATWGTLSTVTESGTVHQLTFAETINVLPGQPVPKLGTGAPLRAARARLYYVTTADELVRMNLAAPRPPGSASEVGVREVLAVGVENLQADCQMSDGGSALLGCAAVVDAADPVSTQAAAAFGTFTAGSGARIAAQTVSRLRTVTMNVVVRSRQPLLDASGDPPIVLKTASGADSQLAPGSASGVSANASFVRRSYRLAAGIRNTSLESL